MKKKKAKKKKLSAVVVLLSFLFVSIAAALFIHSSHSSFMKTLYPLKYEKYVENECENNNLEKSFIYAVIKCESNFQSDAVSSAGAVGLMQILPETFDWLQTKTGESLSEDMLKDPKTSIKYGCLLYGMFVEQFGSEAVAVAAYHAGPNNVKKWLKDERYSSDGKTLFDIPFSSTKAYVENVMKTKNIYEKLYF